MKTFAITAVTMAAAALAAFGVSSAATNAFADSATTTPSASSGAGTLSGDKGVDKGGPESTDTAVTGTEADTVIAAVKAKDATVTIDTVRKDPDGSYDALGTKADGSKVFYDLSTDLATVTENQGGKGAGPGRGASTDTAVTGTEADTVIAAVRAKDATVTIDTVRKDPDGSYDALGTKADGSRVFYDLSTDLATITGH